MVTNEASFQAYAAASGWTAVEKQLNGYEAMWWRMSLHNYQMKQKKLLERFLAHMLRYSPSRAHTLVLDREIVYGKLTF